MKISIITVCKNAEIAIERTILSVVSQTYNNIEYIIVDGASTDGTLDIIKKYEKEVSSRHASTCPEFIEGRFTLHYISEPDSGIYQAMNKGTKMATGDYLLFLNAGDSLLQYNIIKIISEHLQNNKYDIVYGNCISIDPSSGNISIKKGEKTPSSDYFLDHSIPHCAIFYKKHLFEKYGYYSEKYRIISDNIFNKIVFSDDTVVKRYIDINISIFIEDGISSQKEGANFLLHQAERKDFESKYFNEYDKYKVYKRKIIEKRKQKKSILRFFIKILSRLNIWWINR